ncbi:helix-turn-helix domain-containing protein [Sediminibacterium roseum]|uniref:Helix-turn-helix domain-containing protein n=2 Tax=Sediminibacterium roseum TaxID=1978412 RepID=A0ABW9ZTQ7_9BACT|nr:helix-turn-helix domain-containing protein [Sediminibacterium roseum]
MISKKDTVLLQKFGAHIRRLREDKGLSLRELSYACNIDNSKISKIEQGRINVTVLTVLDLSAGLELPPAELMSFQKKV